MNEHDAIDAVCELYDDNDTYNLIGHIDHIDDIAITDDDDT